MRKQFIIYSTASLILVGTIALSWPLILWALIVIAPVILCGLYDMLQTKHTIWRNFPFIGRGRWVMELLRPPLHQYFVESNIDGAPINRMFRSVVYQQAKMELDTVPFGTKVDIYRVGYEWMNHSLSALQEKDLNHDLRMKVGGLSCKMPYGASLLNISAMSFGALRKMRFWR